MAQISTIQKSDITEAGRLDAEYFKPEYLEIEEKLKFKQYSTLESVLGNKNIFSGPFGSALKSDSYQKSGIPFIRISDIQGIFIKKEGLVYISENESKRLNSTTLNIDDIVLSKIGSIGRLSLITDELGKVNISENNIGLRLKNLNQEKKRYLLFFLLSKYGQSQIFRTGSGNVQLKFNVKDIENLVIPDFSLIDLNKFSKLYNEIIQKQTKSKQLYQEAEQLLLTELDLVDYQPQHQLTFSTTKDEAQQAQRFDAEYFQPKYFDIIEKIENYSGGFDVIKNIVDWKKGIEVGTDAYTKTGKDFVRVSDISINGVETSNRKILTTLFTEIKGTFQPKKGEILFTKDGTIGISYLLKDNVDGIISSAFLRLTLQNNYQGFEKESLVLILNSIICKLQIEQLSGGAIIAHLKPSDFEKFKIPLIKQSIQSKIAEKITKSHQLRKESKELLELAKTKVEQEIERT